MNYVIILAGGTGTRVGLDRPKQFVEIFDKPVIAYTIDIFEEHKDINAICIVCHREWREYLEDMVSRYKYKKIKWITDGGNTFQESVISGINTLKGNIKKNDNVLIHYAASPFTSQDIVTDVIRKTEEKRSAVSITPCYQLMGTNDGEYSAKWVDRDELVQIASPQGFRFDYLLDIYERAEKAGILDKIEPHTTSLMYALGDKINKAYGNQTNIKITTREDIELFKGWVLLKNAKRNLLI